MKYTKLPSIKKLDYNEIELNDNKGVGTCDI